MDGGYVCDCSHYELLIERGDEALILLRSDSPVKGRFTARQEIPFEKQLLAFLMILAGLVGLVLARSKNLKMICPTRPNPKNVKLSNH